MEGTGADEVFFGVHESGSGEAVAVQPRPVHHRLGIILVEVLEGEVHSWCS